MVEEKKKVGRPKKSEVEKAREDTEKELKLKGSLKPVVSTPQLPQFINATNFKFINVSFELFREYVYPNGAKIRIIRPLKLSVTNNNTHRLFDSQGLSYYIPPGWISIVWKAIPGAPNFIM